MDDIEAHVNVAQGGVESGVGSVRKAAKLNQKTVTWFLSFSSPCFNSTVSKKLWRIGVYAVYCDRISVRVGSLLRDGSLQLLAIF